MASDQVYIVQDLQNGTTGLTLQGSWTALPNPLLAGNCLLPNDNGSSITFAFNGTEIRLFGASDLSSVAQVSIDSAQPGSSAIGNVFQRAQLYQSSTLQEGDHSITVGGVATESVTCFDFAVIGPGLDTPLLNRSLTMDDTHSTIHYVGDWQAQTDETFIINKQYNAKALFNSTHETSTIGSGFNVTFIGTSLSVFGIISSKQNGNFTLTYSIDGAPPEIQNFTTRITTFDQRDVKLIDTGKLQPTNHTVEVRLSDVVDQTLIVDYIVYTPSFDTLADLANLTAALSLPPATTSTLPESTRSPTPSSTSSNRTSLQVIVGFSVGFVGFLLLVSGLVYWYHRRKKRRSHSAKGDPEQEENNLAVASPVNPYDLKPNFLSDYEPTSSKRMTMLPTASSPTLMTPTRRPPERISSLSGSSAAGASPDNRRRTQDLRRRVDELTEEVERWQALAVPPPAYN